MVTEPKPREWLKLARLRKGHTLTSLAELAGVSPTFISYVENGERTPSGRVAKILSKELNVPMEKFYP